MTKKEFKKALKAVDKKAWKRFKSEVEEELFNISLSDENKPCEVVHGSFLWAETTQGNEYWASIYNRLCLCE